MKEHVRHYSEDDSLCGKHKNGYLCTVERWVRIDVSDQCKNCMKALAQLDGVQGYNERKLKMEELKFQNDLQNLRRLLLDMHSFVHRLSRDRVAGLTYELKRAKRELGHADRKGTESRHNERRPSTATS